MAVKIFLGTPPEHIKQWIINNNKPIDKVKSIFQNNTWKLETEDEKTFNNIHELFTYCNEQIATECFNVVKFYDNILNPYSPYSTDDVDEEYTPSTNNILRDMNYKNLYSKLNSYSCRDYSSIYDSIYMFGGFDLTSYSDIDILTEKNIILNSLDVFEANYTDNALTCLPTNFIKTDYFNIQTATYTFNNVMRVESNFINFEDAYGDSLDNFTIKLPKAISIADNAFNSLYQIKYPIDQISFTIYLNALSKSVIETNLIKWGLDSNNIPQIISITIIGQDGQVSIN